MAQAHGTCIRSKRLGGERALPVEIRKGDDIGIGVRTLRAEEV